MQKVNRFSQALIAVVSVLSASTSNANLHPCDAGRAVALRGDSPAAISKWEKLASDRTPKEKLRAVMTCLRNSGIARTNEDAAKWVVDAAATSKGRAILYAGMLYASGAGVPQDLVRARSYLEKASKLNVDQAKEMLRMLDKADNVN